MESSPHFCDSIPVQGNAKLKIDTAAPSPNVMIHGSKMLFKLVVNLVCKSAGHWKDGPPPLIGGPLVVAQPKVGVVQKKMVMAQHLPGVHIKHC